VLTTIVQTAEDTSLQNVEQSRPRRGAVPLPSPRQVVHSSYSHSINSNNFLLSATKLYYCNFHLRVLTEVRASPLRRATSKIRSKREVASIQQRTLVSDVRSRHKSVKLPERRVRRLQKPRRVRTTGAPGPRGADTGARRKEHRCERKAIEHQGSRGACQLRPGHAPH